MMSQGQILTCQRCGGAYYFGSGQVRWSGPICNCKLYPQTPNPDQPPQQLGRLMGASQLGEIVDLLKQILATLRSKG